MSLLRITLGQLEQEFGAIALRSSDLSPVNRVGGIMGLSELKDRFGRGVGPDGKPWLPLAHPRPEGGSIPLRNHGTLLASYTYESGPDFWRVGTNLKKAVILHRGGTIRATRTRFLAIPLTRQAVYAGSPRNFGGLSPRIKDEKGVMVDAAGTAHYALTKQVTIPARPQVGVSDGLIKRYCETLVNYLRTGSL